MLYVGLIGLVIGSAINAIVWRLYVGRAWTKGRSMCPECKHELAAKDLVPVLSWAALRGKCRYCRQPIHWQYPLVELLTAAAFGLSALILAPVTILDYSVLALWLVVLTLLIIMAVYDARWMILPNKVMYPAIAIAAGLLGVEALAAGSWSVLLGGFGAAALAGGGFFGLVAVTRGKAMGGGDIKLAFLMGLVLGVQGTIVALLIGFYTAAIVGAVVLIRRRRLRGVYIPFGPFLILGTIVAYWYGRSILLWYLQLNGLA